MNNINFKTVYEKYAVRLMSAICLCAGFSLYFNSLLNTELSGAVLFFAAVISAALFAVFNFYNKKLMFYTVILLFAVLIVSLVLLLEIPVADSFNWLFYSRSPLAEHALTYSLISQIILLFAAVGVTFCLLYFKYARLAAGAGLLTFCIIMAVFERSAGFAPILLFFSFIFTVLHEWLLILFPQSPISLGIGISRKTALTYLLPFMIIAGFITAILPSRQEPIRWDFVRNIIKEVQNIVTTIGEQISISLGSRDYEFSISMTGYSDLGNIGGAIADSDKLAVRITNHTDAASHIFLTGSVMDYYTGRGWIRTNNFNHYPMPEYKLDVLEFVLALHYGGVFDESDKDENALGEIFAVREIGIEYLGSRTRTMFHVSKMMQVAVPGSYRTDTSGSSLFFERSAGAGTAYRVIYADFNYNSEVFTDLLENSIHRAHDIESRRLEQLISAHFSGVSFGRIPENYAQILEVRRREIHSVYTQLPDSVPERVYALAREITADYDSDYLKMSALEQFLSSNYTYTKTPQVSLDDGDFADSFLFEMQEGFCTYFATAAAVLGRAAGIPTRYVQGYSAPAGTTANFQSWSIPENTAHAWVEAYIDGAGWVPFEPSPTFSEARYGEWINRRITASTPAIPAAPQTRPGTAPSTPASIDSLESVEPDDGLQSIYLFIFIIGTAIIIVAFLAVFIGIYTAAWRARKKYKTSSPAQRLLMDYKTILLLLELSGNEKIPHETAKLFALRMNDETFIKITDSFEKVRYGGENISAEEAGIAADFKESLLKQAKKIRGKLNYFLYLIKLR
ncbi:MAG: hypothetical protein LBC86_09125 [Oscillospiraceae bacterium]|jgi:hypothetical protein|nr:hypothetical protein [Oscillospiraceae bacterium]